MQYQCICDYIVVIIVTDLTYHRGKFVTIATRGNPHKYPLFTKRGYLHHELQREWMLRSKSEKFRKIKKDLAGRWQDHGWHYQIWKALYIRKRGGNYSIPLKQCLLSSYCSFYCRLNNPNKYRGNLRLIYNYSNYSIKS